MGLKNTFLVKRRKKKLCQETNESKRVKSAVAVKDYISTYVFVNIRKAMLFFIRWKKFVALRGISCFAFSAVEFSVLVINEFHFTTQFRIEQYCEITIKEYLQGHIYNIRRKKGIRTQREIIFKRMFLVISQSRLGNMAGLLKRLLTKPETICRMREEC